MIGCSHCDKVFKYESECKRHELSHLPSFDCNKCGKKFTYLSALRRHQKQHERTGSIQCDQCEHSFKDEYLLKRHIKYAHEGTNICAECDSKFNSKHALRIHMLTHKPKSERKYLCSFKNCNKSFNFTHHLKYHEMTHTNNKQHFCKVCGKGFIQSYNLKVHSKIHEPSKWLSCEFSNCKKKFVSEYARKRHYARHKINIKDNKKSPEILSNIIDSSDEVTCSSCGQILLSSFYEAHLNNCIESKSTKTKDGLFDSQLNVDDYEESGLRNQNVPTSLEITDQYLSTCRHILGKCLVTGDNSVTSNCLCAQMTESDDDYNEAMAHNIQTTNDIKPEPEEVIKKDETLKNMRGACDCSRTKLDVRCENCINISCPKIHKLNHKCDSSNHMLEFEYVDGIVKIINTMDTELKNISKVCNGNKIEKKIVERTTQQSIPYNSCKAVLGKCIVSGNGMMSDDCLCAKMLVDEHQLTSQEIDEITPQLRSNICL